MSKLTEYEQTTKVVLAEKHGATFYVMFAQYVSNDGMDVKTAIFECWNQLECGGKNG